jgi:acyl-CoA synthetase (AMP-forming)/AMP-acid ligase II
MKLGGDLALRSDTEEHHENVVAFPTGKGLATRTRSPELTETLSVLTSGGVETGVRWSKGERLDHLIEHSCDLYSVRDAVLTGTGTLTYRELDAQANQLARHLIAQGIGPGSRVGLMFDKTLETYVALFAVLKVNAAYVPLDAAFPKGRLNYIVGDANLSAILSVSALAGKLEDVTVEQVFIDHERSRIAA